MSILAIRFSNYFDFLTKFCRFTQISSNHAKIDYFKMLIFQYIPLINIDQLSYVVYTYKFYKLIQKLNT